ncbi:hypothetical protein BXO88_12140 [Oribacterium sp. C9]|uniref:hypothetical protein n=1 Tax=Oribacterium sp. C9 TaxID=1943579 RepID=UPI00098E8F27|nr:hypothetical protein [Oribacterium sp. C9]OON85531.1 hypothetical protein BXO88_12140 [Oribacterium sp. C9]
MIYILLHKDIPVCVFELETEVISALINMKTAEHLPLPLKRILHFQSEFVQEELNGQLILNEEGCDLVDFWLNDRTIPANRKNLNKYGPIAKNRLAWMLQNHACSLDDCYWIRSKDEHITWDEVKLYGYDQLDVLTQEKLSEKVHYKDGANSTLGGELEKYWFCKKTDNETFLYLCKKVSPSNDVLCIRELLANLIYEKTGYDNYCRYMYVYNSENQIVGCFCKAFTAENAELITAYDLLEEYNLTQQDDLYSIIAESAEKYGLPKEQTIEYLDIQAVVDYLITNRDRHQGNIGFLRDPDTLRIIRTAPVYDSGSSESMEYELPIDTEHTRVNGLYHTEKECLQHVSDISRIDLSRLPDGNEIKIELEKSSTLNIDRIKFLVKLYTDKVTALKSYKRV